MGDVKTRSKRLSCNDPEYVRSSVCRHLADNVLRQEFVPKDGSPAKGARDGEETILPAYIPYVGPRYFFACPRILCYAINQNLSRHRRWTEDWTQRWVQDTKVAVDRLNQASLDGRSIPIKPYAEGFIPLVAAMAYVTHIEGNSPKEARFIDDLIAVTNFVKFSTADDASSSSIPNTWWAQCGERYVREEILTLEPDIVLAFGQRTHRELQKVLATIPDMNGSPELRLCRFPGRIPSEKARPLTQREKSAWSANLLPLVDAIRKPPDDSYHPWRMTRFPGYFLDVAASWGITLER